MKPHPLRRAFSLAAFSCIALTGYLLLPKTQETPQSLRSESGTPLTSRAEQRGTPGTSGVANKPAVILAENAVPQRLPERERFSSSWGSGTQRDLVAFANWAKEYVAAPGALRGAMTARGVELAQARKKVMADMIKSDPRGAIAQTPPLSIRQKLPPEIQAELEERISDRGDIFRIMGLPQPGANFAIPTVDQARIGNRSFVAHRYGDRTLTPMLTDVSLHGVALGNDLAVLDTPVRKMEPGETPAEVTADCVVTNNRKVIPAGQNAADAEETVMLVGNHGYTLCCPFCAEDFETRMKRMEQQAVSSPKAIQAISADANNPRALSSSGVNGTADYPGKPPTWLTHGAQSVIFLRVDFSDLAYPGNLDANYLTAQVRDWDGLDPFFYRSSYAKTWIGTSDITPVLRMPQPSSFYNSGT